MASERATARQIRCPQCGTVQPIPDLGPPPAAPSEPPPRPLRPRTPLASEPPPPAPRGLLPDGLAAGLYALRALPKMLVVLLAFIGANAMYDLYMNFLLIFLSGLCLFQVLIPLLAGTAIYLMVGFILHFYVEVAASSLYGWAKPPGVPRIGFRDLFDEGLRGVGAVVAYVLPVATLPLLPVGLLGLACCPDARGLNVLWAYRTARRHARVLGRVWGVLGLWLALLAGGAVALRAGVNAAAGLLLRRPGVGLRGELAASAVLVLGSVAMGLWVCTMTCAVFRCVGVLGRCHPELIDALPEQPDPPIVTLTCLGACALAGAAVQYLLWRVLSAVLS